MIGYVPKNMGNIKQRSKLSGSHFFNYSAVAIFLSDVLMIAFLRKLGRNLGNAPDSTAPHFKTEPIALRPSSRSGRGTLCTCAAREGRG